MMSCAAIVLAAGASRRLGQPKQLIEYHGETLLGRAIRLAEVAGAEPVVVVLGAHHEAIRASAELHSAVIIVNEDWEQGIAGSIRAGVDALAGLAPRIAGVLLLTCDQPRLTAPHLRALMEVFAAQSVPVIVASKYAEAIGGPAVFPRPMFGELCKLRGDQGARALIASAPCAVIAIDLPGGEVDIDSPDDLARLGEQ
jgi:molybdenum cofactor cytidylyltransferase